MKSCIIETRNARGESDMEPIIEFDNVSFRYGENAPWILQNCSVTIHENDAIAIIGHTGSGKSTIAKLMNGLLFPQEGEIWINGKKLAEESVWDIRKDVGMVFQNPDNQFVGATVQDDVAFGMENKGVPREEMKQRIETSLKAVQMTEYLLTEPHRLSGGQKQRVAIAGVIAISPKVLILDEATVMLDPQGRTEIMETITQLQKQKNVTLITITHDRNEVIKSERVIVLNQGKMWEIATPRNILNHGKELQEIGLDIPFISELSHELKMTGINLKKDPLTADEMLEELWILHSRT